MNMEHTNGIRPTLLNYSGKLYMNLSLKARVYTMLTKWLIGSFFFLFFWIYYITSTHVIYCYELMVLPFTNPWLKLVLGGSDMEEKG